MTAKRSMRKAAIKIQPQRVEEVAPEPEAPEPEAETLKAEASPFGDFDISAAISMAQPLIDKAVADNLSKMDIPVLMRNLIKEELAPTINTINTVKEQLQPLILASQQLAGNNGASGQGEIANQPDGQNVNVPSALSPRASNFLDMLVDKGINKLVGGIGSNPAGGGFNLESILKQQEQIAKLAELFSKPYRDAEESALKRVNLLLGIGGKAGLTPAEAMAKVEGLE